MLLLCINAASIRNTDHDFAVAEGIIWRMYANRVTRVNADFDVGMCDSTGGSQLT